MNIKKDIGISSIDMSYGLSNDQLADTKIDKTRKLDSLINDVINNYESINKDKLVDTLNDILHTSDYRDFLSALTNINSCLYRINRKDKFWTILYIIRIIIREYLNRYDLLHSDEINNILSVLINNLETDINENDEYLNDSDIDTCIKIIGGDILNITMKKLTEPLKCIYVSPLDKAKFINHNKMLTESSGTIIKSIANYSVSKYFPQLTNDQFDSEEYIKSIYSEKDEDYLVNKTYKLHLYLKDIVNKLDNDENLKAVITLIEFFKSKFIYNTTGLKILTGEMEKCIEILDNTISINYNHKDNINDLKSICHKVIDDISDYLDNDSNTNLTHSSPLIEMGFSYIYDTIPSDVSLINNDNIDMISNALTEAIDSYNIYEVLTEGIMNRVKIRDEVKDDQYRQKLVDDYDRKKRIKEDKYDTKKRDKERIKDDNYNFNRRKKDEKYEAKKQEKERKKFETKIGKEKWKTIKLSVPEVYSGVRALKRLVAALAIGGASLAAGINPIFLPVVYLLTRFLRDKTTPDHEKRKIMLEIKTTLGQIDAKLEQAERQNDMKQKYALMKMKDKLESIYNRNNFDSRRGAFI